MLLMSEGLEFVNISAVLGLGMLNLLVSIDGPKTERCCLKKYLMLNFVLLGLIE